MALRWTTNALLAAAVDKGKTLLTLADDALALATGDVGCAVDGSAVNATLTDATTTGLEVVVDVNTVKAVAVTLDTEHSGDLAHGVVGWA